jgi:hypothetical protein
MGPDTIVPRESEDWVPRRVQLVPAHDRTLRLVVVWMRSFRENLVEGLGVGEGGGRSERTWWRDSELEREKV